MSDRWLTQWKQIAMHLGLSARTLQHYHQRYPMPLTRSPGGSPSIRISDLDAWWVRIGGGPAPKVRPGR